MARELITSWGDYQSAIDRLLASATQKIWIYDEDLTTLQLESVSRHEILRRIAHTGCSDAVQIAVRNATPIRERQPRLLNLLSLYSHSASLQATPEQLAHLRDSMILVDERHALIRFDRDQARSKLLIDEADEIRPYLKRFTEIWTEGGEGFSSTTLGL